jgi:hypothetical protein
MVAQEVDAGVGKRGTSVVVVVVVVVVRLSFRISHTIVVIGVPLVVLFVLYGVQNPGPINLCFSLVAQKRGLKVMLIPELPFWHLT